MTEKGFQKYAWILVFVPAAVLFIYPIGFGWLSSSPEPDVIKAVTGMSLDQIGAQNQGTVWLILELYHEFALTVLAFGAITMAIAAFQFRKGHKFAWYVSWLVPALWLGILALLLYLNIAHLSTTPASPPYPLLIFPLRCFGPVASLQEVLSEEATHLSPLTSEEFPTIFWSEVSATATKFHILQRSNQTIYQTLGVGPL